MSDKLQELILYIAHKSHDDPSFGVTKLNKILFLADFMAYGYFGESITGTTYVRRQFGPAPRDMASVLSEMEVAGRVQVVELPHYGYTQKRPLPKENANLSLFTPEQINLATEVIGQCEGMSAAELSEWSHTLTPWLSAGDGEELPYETVFVLKHMTVSRADMGWAMEAVDELLAG